MKTARPLHAPEPREGTHDLDRGAAPRHSGVGAGERCAARRRDHRAGSLGLEAVAGARARRSRRRLPARRGRGDHRRLSGSPQPRERRATAEVWEALEQADARLVARRTKGSTRRAGDQELLFTIKAAIAREQWKRSPSELGAARRNSVERGVFPGRTPIGYRRDKRGRFVPDRRQASKVVRAFELRREGLPQTEIARRLGWSHSTTRQILVNEVYLGVVRHGDSRKEGAHKAIVSRELFDAVQATRTTEPVPSGETTRDRLLQGDRGLLGMRANAQGRSPPSRRAELRRLLLLQERCVGACPSRAYVHADELDAYIEGWFTEALRERSADDRRRFRRPRARGSAARA